MKAIHIITGVSALALLIIGIFIYYKFVGAPAVPPGLKDYYVEIPTNSSFEEVVGILKDKGVLEDEKVFTLLAERMKYKRDPMRAGRFELQPGWSLIQMIRHLRGGSQAPVDVILTNERLPENVAAKAARFLEPDSIDILTLFRDEDYLASIGYTPETLMSLFIPNTYEFFWNTNPKGFTERMIKEHDAFWDSESRRKKAEALGLTPQEVYTLASIVEKETLVNQEKPRMAGVYLNRLRTGMRLQADPTAVFARRDFDTPRVTHYHTKYDSPYNTYLYAGLPPGPISMASISSIDAVLNAENHDYVYFCAKGDGSGLHAFAKTLPGHNSNVVEYKRNLRRRGLR
ncbi:MAG: endolytic transglycosylase MltG [Lewinellaceae bacterium]|nr:endolytic transglycosylase MltG [Lewinellaceae bacterium]MCB9288489.1 endolytic transglycosylase MltG [Lewinellaceae bacterium]